MVTHEDRTWAGLVQIDVAILILHPATGRKIFSNTYFNFAEMLSVIPPIFLLLGLLDVWVGGCPEGDDNQIPGGAFRHPRCFSQHLYGRCAKSTVEDESDHKHPPISYQFNLTLRC